VMLGGAACAGIERRGIEDNSRITTSNNIFNLLIF